MVACVVHRGHTRGESPRAGGEEDQQGDGEHSEEIQRSLVVDAFALSFDLEVSPDGNLDGYQKKK